MLPSITTRFDIEYSNVNARKQIQLNTSSVKWSDPGLLLKAQGKFIFSFPGTLFLHIFDT